MNVGDLLTNAGTSYRDHPAFIFKDEKRTYGESLRRVDALCQNLNRLGLRAHERVAIYMPNCPEYLEVMFAVWKLGGVVVPLNSTFTANELAWHLTDSESTVLVAHTAAAAVVKQVRTQADSLKHIIWTENGPEPTEYRDQHDTTDHLLSDFIEQGGSMPYASATVAPEDLAWLAYTSGTTGRPKGAMLSHRALLYQALSALADCEQLTQEHVGMHAAPLSHGSGHNALAFTMKACSQVIHQASGFDVQLLFDQIERYHVAALFLVPTQLKLIVDHPEVVKRDLSSLQWVVYGGAPMYRENQRKALKVLGRVLVQIFGQTESPMSGTVLPREEHSLDDSDARALSVGRVRHGLDIRIIDSEGRPSPRDTAGEICLRGDSLMNGYWRRPKATTETLVDGWLRTGDIGRLDERGYLYILDRNKDMIISGGLNVYPSEIEEVLLTHPDVAEACVIGVPDEKWGEAVRAVVVSASPSDPTPEELIDLVGQHLAPYKKPKAVDFVDALPKTSYGKVAKREIRDQYWSHLSRNL